MAVYNSILYSSTFAANYYPGIFSVNSTNGNYIASNLFTYFSQSASDSGAFDILAADDKYIYSFIMRYSIGYSKNSIMILTRGTLTPIKILVISQSNFIIYMGINYYDAIFRFIVPFNNLAYVISMDTNLKMISSKINLGTSNSEINYVIDYNENINGDAYFIIQVNQKTNTSNFSYSTIVKTDTNLTKLECDVFDFNPADSFNSNLTSNDQYTFSEIIYDPNGTNSNDVHWFGSDMNFKYLSNLSLFYDASEFANYTQVAITS